MVRKVLCFFCIALAAGCVEVDETAFSPVLKEDERTYIVDRTGKRWDISQALSLGFKPDKFQYGLGKDAFTPLDDTHLSSDSNNVPESLRVIGVAEGNDSRAYSVSRLRRHEISNSMLSNKPVAVGY